MCIDMHYIQDQCDKHRKPSSAGHTVLGLVITETDHVTVFCDLCAYVCSVCVFVYVCTCVRESSVTLVTGLWTGQSSIPILAGAMAVGPTQQQRPVQWLP